MNPPPSQHFQRFTVEDQEHLQHQIEEARGALAQAIAQNDDVAILDAAASLGEMLTTARNEEEAHTVLLEHLELARQHLSTEAAGWLLLSLATANQYLNLREHANQQFAEALYLAQHQGWRNLEHYVLHHWGRSLAEEGEIGRAKECFSVALKLREAMNEPRQESTRQALAALAALEST